MARDQKNFILERFRCYYCIRFREPNCYLQRRRCKIFVSHILYRSEKYGFSRGILINQSIDTNSFLVHDLNKPVKDLSKWGVGHFTEDLWQNVLLKSRLNSSECILWHFFCPDDPTYQTFKSFIGKNFREVPIEATLYFHSGHHGQLISQNFKLWAVPHIQRTGICAKQFSAGQGSNSEMRTAPLLGK